MNIAKYDEIFDKLQKDYPDYQNSINTARLFMSKMSAVYGIPAIRFVEFSDLEYKLHLDWFNPVNEFELSIKFGESNKLEYFYSYKNKDGGHAAGANTLSFTKNDEIPPEIIYILKCWIRND